MYCTYRIQIFRAKLSYSSICSALNQININKFFFNLVFLKSESVALCSADVVVNEDKPKLSSFHVSITTRYLLEHGLKTRHLCTDATYKLMWHRFPVFLIGVTDIIIWLLKPTIL